MITKFKRFVNDQRGVTAIEYGIIAGIIAIALITSVGSVSGQLTATFDKIATALTPK